MTERDHHVAFADAQAPDRARKERKKPAIVAPDAGQPLEDRGVDLVRLDPGRHGSAVPQQGVDRCPGKHRAQPLEDALPAAHPGEPVVHQDDSHAGAARAWLAASRASPGAASQDRALQANPTIV